MMLIDYILYLLIIIINDCSSSLTLLKRLRRDKTIAFESSLSSPIEFNIIEGSKFRLTCSFLSNFDKVNIFWFHNDILIQSFISKNILEEEDDNYLSVTIISTIEIDKTNLDMIGTYQCVGIHEQINSQKYFHIQVIENETNSIKRNFPEDALITVHTYQSLFEPRSSISLMCRFGVNKKAKCTIKWFDPEYKLLDTFEEQTDLVLKDATFEDNMGLYTCQICCQNQCQSLTSFVYPAGSNK